MAQLCGWAVVHWVRFTTGRTAETLDLFGRPEGCASWKFGPDAAASPAAGRLGSTIWGGMAAFDDAAQAQAAYEGPHDYVPGLGEASEAWRALLVPFAHSGTCNHLDPAAPGPMFAPRGEDPGGPLFVMTSAGFDLRSKSDFQRLIDFRRRVERLRSEVAAAEGSLAHQVFVPHGAGDDGVTMSLWRDDKSMLAFAYRPGPHRVELDRQKSGKTVDRSSFTRFRILRTAGRWGGIDPLGGV